MFMEPERTQFDLGWRMFGIYVRVHPMFWLVTVLLGWPSGARADWLGLLLVWVGCVFVSILVHELGHVFAGRLFGADGHIVLYGMGGLAIGSSNLPERGQRIIVYFAGPLAGFLFLGAILAGIFLALPEGPPLAIPRFPLGWIRVLHLQMVAADWAPLAIAAVMDLIWINLFWGILNLMPIWPLDGGRISREALEWISPRRGTGISLLLSGGVAALLAINSLAAYAGRPFLPYVPALGLFGTLFFAMFAVTSFQLYQAESGRTRWHRDDPSPWDRYDDDWRRDRNTWGR